MVPPKLQVAPAFCPATPAPGKAALMGHCGLTMNPPENSTRGIQPRVPQAVWPLSVRPCR